MAVSRSVSQSEFQISVVYVAKVLSAHFSTSLRIFIRTQIQSILMPSLLLLLKKDMAFLFIVYSLFFHRIIFRNNNIMKFFIQRLDRLAKTIRRIQSCQHVHASILPTRRASTSCIQRVLEHELLLQGTAGRSRIVLPYGSFLQRASEDQERRAGREVQRRGGTGSPVGIQRIEKFITAIDKLDGRK